MIDPYVLDMDGNEVRVGDAVICYSPNDRPTTYGKVVKISYEESKGEVKPYVFVEDRRTQVDPSAIKAVTDDSLSSFVLIELVKMGLYKHIQKYDLVGLAERISAKAEEMAHAG
jgi:hypothetical protein